MFEILVPDSFKMKPVKDICPLIYKLQNHDWNSLSYGLSFNIDEKKEHNPIAAGLPTTNGSIIFWGVGYDDDGLLEYAKDKVSKETYEQLESSGDMSEVLSERVRNELGNGHLEFVDALQFDLLVAVPVTSLAEDIEDVSGHIKKEIKKLKAVLEISQKIRDPKSKKKKSNPSMFDDVELHVWKMQYAERETVLESVKDLTDPERIIEGWDDVCADFEEEDEETSLVLNLRSTVNAKTTLGELEEQISEELKGLDGAFEPRPAFITLIA